MLFLFLCLFAAHADARLGSSLWGRLKSYSPFTTRTILSQKNHGFFNKAGFIKAPIYSVRNPFIGAALGISVYMGYKKRNAIYAQDVNHQQEERERLTALMQTYENNPGAVIKQLLYSREYDDLIATHVPELLTSQRGKKLILTIFKADTNALESLKKALAPGLSIYIQNSFQEVMYDTTATELVSSYYTYLEISDDAEISSLKKEELKRGAGLLVGSLDTIVETLDERLTEFFYKVVPKYRIFLYEDYKKEISDYFKQKIGKIVQLGNKNHYIVFALFKLFMETDPHDHEHLFADELFKRIDEFADFYYLDLIQSPEAKKRVVGYSIQQLSQVSDKKEIMHTISYWIYENPSLATFFSSSEVITMLLNKQNGSMVIPFLIQSNDSIKALVERIKKSQAA